jgi:hypothetical protein
MRAAWIGLVLAPRQRAALARKVRKRLPRSTPDQQSRFLDVVEEHVDGYRKLALPASQERADRERQMQKVVEAGRAYAQAIAELGPDSGDILQQKQWVEMGRPPTTIPPFGRTVEGARWAGITAAAAERCIAEMRRKRAPGPRADAGLSTLIGDIAYAYGAIFGEPVSPRRSGIFAHVLADVMLACDVRDPRRPSEVVKIGESRLRSILEKRLLPGWDSTDRRDTNLPRK